MDDLPRTQPLRRMALLLSLSSFEGFYGGVMHLTCESYVAGYRHDFSFQYAKGLQKLGIDVILYMPSWRCRGLHALDAGIWVRFLPLSSWYKVWEISWLKRSPVGRYIAQVAGTMAFSGELKRAIEEDEITTLYVQEYWTGRFDYLVRTFRLPIIGADHGGSKRRQLTFRKRGSFQRAAAITCQTEDECRVVSEFGGCPTLLRNGVDTGIYTPGSGARGKTVLLVARMTNRQKRVSDLIEAMLFLPEEWTLQIAGSGPDGEILRKLVQEKGLADRVVFLGFVREKAELVELYRRCGVYAMPSAVEGLPLAILEAMSCGCAVVVSDIRAFDGIVEQAVTGYRVGVGDIEGLASGILQAAAACERLGRAARERVVERFSADVMARRLRDLTVDVESSAGTGLHGAIHRGTRESR